MKVRPVPTALLALALVLALGVVVEAVSRSYGFGNGLTLEAGFTQQVTASPVIEYMGQGYCGVSECDAFDANNTYANDQYSEITLGPTFNTAGPTVRANGVDGGRNYMWLEVYNDQYMYLDSVISGSRTHETAIFDGGAGYFLSGQVIRLTVTGTSYAFTKDTVACCNSPATFSNAAVASGAAGFSTLSGNPSLDYWTGADGAGAGGSSAPHTLPITGVGAFLYLPPLQSRAGLRLGSL